MPRPALHFVGLRDERYRSAVAVWGPPDFVHPCWDRWAFNDVAPGDTVIFATGEADQPVRERRKRTTSG